MSCHSYLPPGAVCLPELNDSLPSVGLVHVNFVSCSEHQASFSLWSLCRSFPASTGRPVGVSLASHMKDVVRLSQTFPAIQPLELQPSECNADEVFQLRSQPSVFAIVGFCLANEIFKKALSETSTILIQNLSCWIPLHYCSDLTSSRHSSTIKVTRPTNGTWFRCELQFCAPTLLTSSVPKPLTNMTQLPYAQSITIAPVNSYGQILECPVSKQYLSTLLAGVIVTPGLLLSVSAWFGLSELSQGEGDHFSFVKVVDVSFVKQHSGEAQKKGQSNSGGPIGIVPFEKAKVLWSSRSVTEHGFGASSSSPPREPSSSSSVREESPTSPFLDSIVPLASLAEAIHTNALLSKTIKHTQGILLHGPKGCGKKTTLLEALRRIKSVRDILWIRSPFQHTLPQLRMAQLEPTSERTSLVVVVLSPLNEFFPLGNDPLCRHVASWIQGLHQRIGCHVLIGLSTDASTVQDDARSWHFTSVIEFPLPTEQSRLAVMRHITRRDNCGRVQSNESWESLCVRCLEEAAGRLIGRSLAEVCSFTLSQRDSLFHPFGLRKRLNGGVTPSKENTIEALDAVAVTALKTPKADTPAFSLTLPQPPSSKSESSLWESIGGLEQVKATLQRAILDPINKADVYAKFNLSGASGVLLHGPPGNAKTSLIRALCQEQHRQCIGGSGGRLTLLYLDCASVLSAYVGEAEQRIRDVFRDARRHRPSLIFFDEVDAIAKARKHSNQGNSHDARLLSTLLAEMDGVGGKNIGVCFVGATNLAEHLDSAVLRPGRFDAVCHVPCPDAAGRAAILRIHLQNQSMSFTKVDVDVAASCFALTGYSGADIVAGIQVLASWIIASGLDPAEVTTGKVIDALLSIRRTVA